MRTLEVGVTWIHPKTKRPVTSSIVAPLLCADAPIRAQVQSILSHGGRFCCHNFEEKMIKLPAELIVPGEKRKKKRKRGFKYNEVPGQLRTAVRMEAQASATR